MTKMSITLLLVVLTVSGFSHVVYAADDSSVIDFRGNDMNY